MFSGVLFFHFLFLDFEDTFDENGHFSLFDEAIFVFIELIEELIEPVYIVVGCSLRGRRFLELINKVIAFFLIKHSILINIHSVPQFIHINFKVQAIISQMISQTLLHLLLDGGLLELSTSLLEHLLDEHRHLRFVEIAVLVFIKLLEHVFEVLFREIQCSVFVDHAL